MGALMHLSLSTPVVAAWGVWLTVGLVLVVWARRARAASLLAGAQYSTARYVAPRAKSSVRPSKAGPSADAFEELQALLDPPLSDSRRPGD